MLYEDLPVELKEKLETEKVAMGRWPAGLDAPRRYDDIILVDNDSVLVENLETKGYTKTTVSNWYGKVAKPFIGDNDDCLKLVYNALGMWDEIEELEAGVDDVEPTTDEEDDEA